MDWAILIVAGILEVAWAVGLKYSDGFSRLWPSLATVAALAGSMVLLALALRTLPLGTAYTVWTGIGAIGTVILGIALFGEAASAARLGCISLILIGIVGLKLTTTSKAAEAKSTAAAAPPGPVSKESVPNDGT